MYATCFGLCLGHPQACQYTKITKNYITKLYYIILYMPIQKYYKGKK
jgi:hypothetical protein